MFVYTIAFNDNGNNKVAKINSISEFDAMASLFEMHPDAMNLAVINCKPAYTNNVIYVDFIAKKRVVIDQVA